ncbi:MAG TPA: mechanosensitive ion channel [Ignavibacteriaceae bacterium]|nr:mechanosensitive ion channel [Ignavibacteriaceae bacterium]
MNVKNVYNSVVGKLQDWLNTLIQMLPNIAVAVVVLLLFYIIARIIKRFTSKVLNKFSDHVAVIRLVSQMMFLMVFLVGFFISLGILNLDKAVTTLLAGAGIIGLAIGFAFKDIASNFISGIILTIHQPFRINDIIKSNEFFGTVSKITLRTTNITTPQGERVLIPNKDVFQNPLINYSQTGRRRIDLNVGVSYGDDLDKVKRITIEAVKDVPNRITDKEIELFYSEFGNSSINFVVRIWTNYTTQKEYKHSISEAVQKIKKAYDENAIMIPFPIRTLDFGIKGGEKLSEVLTGNHNEGDKQEKGTKS